MNYGTYAKYKIIFIYIYIETKEFFQPTKPPASQPTRQPASQLASQPASQPANQTASRPANPPTDQPASQPARQHHGALCSFAWK